MLGDTSKKTSAVIVDSRFLKIVAAKKDELQDALIFVCLNEQKYGHLQKGQLRKIVETLEKIAPDSVWFGATKDYSMQIVDKKDLRNKDLLVTLKYEDVTLVDKNFVEDMVRKALPEAKSLSFVHAEADMDIEEK